MTCTGQVTRPVSSSTTDAVVPAFSFTDAVVPAFTFYCSGNELQLVGTTCNSFARLTNSFRSPS